MKPSEQPFRVGFQGEIGAYSEEALAALYPDSQKVPFASFEAAFDAVTHGEVDRAVLPIENSLFGSVHQNYDLLLEHDLVILAEVQLRIRHQLMANAGMSIEDIVRVTSHPQALGQCRDFLRNRLPMAEIQSAYDTAGAAKLVASRGSTDEAAIASRAAAATYGLQILAEDIESNHANFTRFLALGRADADASAGLAAAARSSDEWRTTLVYAQRENVPGGLFKSLAVFALRDIDLLKIESRPLVGSPGKYVFYLDLQGHRDDEPVRHALRHLDEIAARVKVLGSYRTGPTVD
ncbi:MAG: prephenate dehydratase [Bacteroidota bacterium]|nr:prephenate dehydratase [Bacteroidota bacterium]